MELNRRDRSLVHSVRAAERGLAPPRWGACNRQAQTAHCSAQVPGHKWLP